MVRYRFIFLVFLLLSPVTLNAMEGVFWQPQNRDLNISDAKWQALMHDVRKTGFDTLIVQWTGYGDSFSTLEDRKKLQEKIYAAKQAGLNLILGLYMDPEFFERQKQPAAALQNYLDKLRVLDIKHLQLLQEELLIEPDGWYLSAEIDDFQWREQSARSLMLKWLKDTRVQIEKHSEQPVYISSFFVGNMTPKAYAGLLRKIQEEGLKVWVQDGSGVNKLTETQRSLYINNIFDCIDKRNNAADGIIYEVFMADVNKQFNALPKPIDELNKLLTNESFCTSKRALFSLRYLPISAGVLNYDVNQSSNKE